MPFQSGEAQQGYLPPQRRQCATRSGMVGRSVRSRQAAQRQRIRERREGAETLFAIISRRQSHIITLKTPARVLPHADARSAARRAAAARRPPGAARRQRRYAVRFNAPISLEGFFAHATVHRVSRRLSPDVSRQQKVAIRAARSNQNSAVSSEKGRADSGVVAGGAGLPLRLCARQASVVVGRDSGTEKSNRSHAIAASPRAGTRRRRSGFAPPVLRSPSLRYSIAEDA